MCQLCDENDGDWVTCQFCSVGICWDVANGDDCLQPAAATASGDLACRPCAIRHDREEEREDAEDYIGHALDYDQEDEDDVLLDETPEFDGDGTGN